MAEVGISPLPGLSTGGRWQQFYGAPSPGTLEGWTSRVGVGVSRRWMKKHENAEPGFIQKIRAALLLMGYRLPG